MFGKPQMPSFRRMPCETEVHVMQGVASWYSLASWDLVGNKGRNILHRDYTGIIFPYWILRTRKLHHGFP